MHPITEARIVEETGLPVVSESLAEAATTGGGKRAEPRNAADHGMANSCAQMSPDPAAGNALSSSRIRSWSV
jgi:hypothetical protein